MSLIEGSFVGRAVKAEIGANPKTGKPQVRISMEVTEGEHKGKQFPYEGKLDAQNIKFTKTSMMAIGWCGWSAQTFGPDVKEANVTAPFEVVIATWKRPDGTERQWSSVRSIGLGVQPLEKLNADAMREVDSWFAEVGDAKPAPSPQTREDADIPF